MQRDELVGAVVTLAEDELSRRDVVVGCPVGKARAVRRAEECGQRSWAAGEGEAAAHQLLPSGGEGTHPLVEHRLVRLTPLLEVAFAVAVEVVVSREVGLQAGPLCR